MKTFLVFDKGFPLEKEKLVGFLNQKVNSIKFEINEQEINLQDKLIKVPNTSSETFIRVQKEIKKAVNTDDKIFFFTTKQYEDNFFFHEYGNLTIFSFYGWSYLTSLPISNGVLYFIIEYFALQINIGGFRHQRNTGCIYDFLGDKRGIDDGMRQARFCPNCLDRLKNGLIKEHDFEIFQDLRILTNHLSESSRWNEDVLSNTAQETTPANIPKTRKPKKTDEINVFIASSDDTEAEKQILRDSLETRFRRNNHEQHCGFRIKVFSWEDLPPQPGHPQDIINARLINNSDFIIGIFKHKAGDGTMNEILKTLDLSNVNNPIGMPYFYSTAPIVPLDSPDIEQIIKEWKKLTDFRKKIQNKAIYKNYPPFNKPEELLNRVLLDLENNISMYIEK
ncbi:MAG: hypothetical protein LBV16_03335 [Elusimicrobiota bacterium]|jgi:hypothetical protein|nr:hypothetical protein [Elusimicrobiota bacterium]